jgi:hypothetical protein
MIDRAAIFGGTILRLAASPESRTLAKIAAAHAARAFACDEEALPALHEARDGDDVWSRTCAARAALAADPQAARACVALAESLAFERAELAFDAPRLRVVAPSAHLRAAASRAYYMHRDTWYGSPRAQVNVWIPLFDVGERDSFALYPQVFARAVQNDSGEFDYARFVARGGFQNTSAIDASYPRALLGPFGPHEPVIARAHEIVAFSAAHLHATTPNETSRTRLSIDVRFVDMRDVAAGHGALDVDNASRGCALADYARGDR